MIDPIEAFLSSQAEGGRLDSGGSFTVSGERALRKLSSFQLPRSSAWVLKMVQGGVEGGASGIWFTHGAKSCRVAFKDGALGSLEELWEAWLSPAPVVNPAQRNFLIGLRTVAIGRKRPVLVGARTKSDGLRFFFWSGERLEPIQAASRSILTGMKLGWPELGETVFFVGASPLGSLEGAVNKKGIHDATASEFLELARYGVSCPVPLWVDSRSLNHFGLDDVSMTREGLAFSACPYHPEKQDWPPLKLPSLEQEAAVAWTLMYSQQPEPSKISWVRRGVVCEEETLLGSFTRFQVRIFCSVDDLETDLTALQVKFPSRKERRERTVQAVQRFCSEIEEGSPVPARIEEKRGSAFRKWGGAVCFVIGGALFAPATSGYSLLAGIGGALGMSLRSNRSSAKLEGLQEFRERLVNYYK